MRRSVSVVLGLIIAVCASGCSSGEEAPAADESLPEELLGEMTPFERTDGTWEIPTVDVPAQCASAFEEMAAGYTALYAQADYTDEEANALEVAPLTACETVVQWISAARENPGAIGLSGPSFVSELDIQVRCDATFPELRSTPTCQDALEHGLVD